MSEKSLPVFGPDQAEESPGVPVFGLPREPEPVSLPVWGAAVQDQTHEPVALFGPEFEEPEESLVLFGLAGSEAQESPALFVPPEPTSVGTVATAAANSTDAPARQTQREVDRIIREFLVNIKAKEVRLRRVGHTTYTWLHEIEPIPHDTGSDLRWEIRMSGLQIHMGIYDIKPFFRVLSGPFTPEGLKKVWQDIQDEMDRDAGLF